MIHRYETVVSTNDIAKTLASQGAQHGTAVLARHQTGGRGRLGRSFHSPQNVGMYYSMILRPDCQPQALMHLTCAVALAVCDAVEETAGIRPGIKWINDLVLQNKKLGGILTELTIDPDTGKVAYAIVGIGINCNQAADAFPQPLQTIATSLLACTGKTCDPEALAQALTQKLLQISARLIPEQNAIMESYRRQCITLGQPIAVIQGEEKRYGTALDIREDGSLLVRFSDGTAQTVSYGDVSVRGMYGYV